MGMRLWTYLRLGAFKVVRCPEEPLRSAATLNSYVCGSPVGPTVTISGSFSKLCVSVLVLGFRGLKLLELALLLAVSDDGDHWDSWPSNWKGCL